SDLGFINGVCGLYDFEIDVVFRVAGKTRACVV
ncbi:unnamed protein product, partial [Didymodactylos carnosus]